MKKTFLASILMLFIVLSAVFYWLNTLSLGYNYTVLMTGNVVMAALSLITFFIVTKQISSNPNAFVRGVYASSFLKLFICVIAIVLYAILNKPNVHKPSLFALFGVYAVYSAIETIMLSKLARGIK